MIANLIQYRQDIKGAPTDYKDSDGLVCCGICHKRKEFRYGKFVTGCACDCDTQIFAARKQAKQLKEFQHNAFDTVKYESMTFANSDCVMGKAKKYTDNFGKELVWLYIYGNVGSGKTYMAVSILNELMNKGYRCKFSSLPKITREYFASENKPLYLEKLLTYDVLVIDDFGVEQSSNFVNEIALAIVNGYYERSKTLIITTNFSIEEICKRDNQELKNRLYDRLMEMCYPIKWERQSKRIDIAKERAARIKAMMED